MDRTRPFSARRNLRRRAQGGFADCWSAFQRKNNWQLAEYCGQQKPCA